MITDPLFLDAVEKLKATVHQGRTIEAAQVQVIGLDVIRRASGDDWSKIKERVRNNSLSFLQGCLANNDILLPCGDGFLVIFADGASRDLAKECGSLKDSLNAFYLGDPTTQNLRTEVRPQDLDADGVVEIISEEAAKEQDWAVEVEDPFAIHHQIVLAPVWAAGPEVISTYCATPEYYESGVPRTGYNPNYRLGGSNEGCDYLDLDMRVINHALKALARSLADGRRCLIGYTVHSSTMQNRAARSAILERLSATPLHARRYLMAKIAEVEPGTPLVRIADWVGNLRTVTQRVVVELHPSERSLDGLGTTGASAVGFFVPMAGPLRDDTRQRHAANIARWAGTLHRQGVKLFVDNLRDLPLLEAACEAGADFLSSDVAWPGPEHPEGVTAFPRANVRAAFKGSLRA